MIVYLPRGLEVDLDNVPDDFELQIQECFTEYTNGTASDYVFQDKLAFIDLAVRMIRGERCADDAVIELIKDSMANDLRNGQFPQQEDYYSLDFMVHCYEQGIQSQQMYCTVCEDCRTEEKIEKLILRMITAVVTWYKL